MFFTDDNFIPLADSIFMGMNKETGLPYTAIKPFNQKTARLIAQRNGALSSHEYSLSLPKSLYESEEHLQAHEVNKITSAEVTSWLIKQVPFSYTNLEVICCYGSGNALLIPWEYFCQYWAELTGPMTRVSVWPLDESWLLQYEYRLGFVFAHRRLEVDVEDRVEFELVLASLLTESNIAIQKQRFEGLKPLDSSFGFNLLVQQMFDQSKTGYNRAMAANALGYLGGLHAIVPLVQALDDTYGGLVNQVIFVLAQLGDSIVIKPLLSLLSTIDQKNGPILLANSVKWNIVKALSMLGDISILPVLLEMQNATGETIGRDSIAVAVAEAIESIQERTNMPKS
jgi:hypothetical protein